MQFELQYVYGQIQDRYNHITLDVIGTVSILYYMLNNSDTMSYGYVNGYEPILLEEPKDPKYKIENINKCLIRCIRGNLVGSKLWIAYKFSNKKVDELITNIENWNLDMVDAVNTQCVPGNVQQPELKIPKEAPSMDLSGTENINLFY
jgi:hypothetical protein